jgi:hypothetical protein
MKSSTSKLLVGDCKRFQFTGINFVCCGSHSDGFLSDREESFLPMWTANVASKLCFVERTARGAVQYFVPGARVLSTSIRAVYAGFGL